MSMLITIALPPVEFLRECFSYNYDSGELWWRNRPREHFRSEDRWKFFNTRYAGRTAGSYHNRGYRAVEFTFGGTKFGTLSHRVIWALTTAHGLLIKLNISMVLGLIIILRIFARRREMNKCKTYVGRRTTRAASSGFHGIIDQRNGRPGRDRRSSLSSRPFPGSRTSFRRLSRRQARDPSLSANSARRLTSCLLWPAQSGVNIPVQSLPGRFRRRSE
jgi:hypothetical protein